MAESEYVHPGNHCGGTGKFEGRGRGGRASLSTWTSRRSAFFTSSTARPLWSYLSRILGNPTLADDLVQESYYRFLRATLKSDDAAYQKAYLFRIATNLANDHWRRLPRHQQAEAANPDEVPGYDRTAEHVQQRSDLGAGCAA